MNKYIISALMLLLSVSGAKAQGVLVGDANHDGQLTIADVTATTQVLLGKSPQTYIATFESYIRDNSLSGSLSGNGVTKAYKNGYEYVDLGLPSKTMWCATNVGGYTASDAGTATTWSNASGNLPADWTLPTEVQIQELIDNCTVTADGQNLKVTSKADATKYILIPAGTPKLWSATEGTALTVNADAIAISTGETGALYIRPVITASSSSTSDNEIGQGEDNADTYTKKRTAVTPDSENGF